MTASEAGAEPAAVVHAILGETIRLHQEFRQLNPTPIVQAAKTMVDVLKGAGRVLVFGNGGSAAEAQHFSAELVSRFVRERGAVAALALTTDTSILTAIGNDYSFDRVFARQIEALGRSGDVAFGISTSGQSANVIEGFKAAKARGLTTVALTGRDGGAMASADIHINVPDPSTARVQEVQLTVLHIICELVERELG